MEVIQENNENNEPNMDNFDGGISGEIINDYDINTLSHNNSEGNMTH